MEDDLDPSSFLPFIFNRFLADDDLNLYRCLLQPSMPLSSTSTSTDAISSAITPAVTILSNTILPIPTATTPSALTTGITTPPVSSSASPSQLQQPQAVHTATAGSTWTSPGGSFARLNHSSELAHALGGLGPGSGVEKKKEGEKEKDPNVDPTSAAEATVDPQIITSIPLSPSRSTIRSESHSLFRIFASLALISHRTNAGFIEVPTIKQASSSAREREERRGGANHSFHRAPTETVPRRDEHSRRASETIAA